jgi:Gram-negative bacterial TonB protein C-terminal
MGGRVSICMSTRDKLYPLLHLKKTPLRTYVNYWDAIIMSQKFHMFSMALIGAFVAGSTTIAQTTDNTMQNIPPGAAAAPPAIMPPALPAISNDPLAHYRAYEAAIARSDFTSASAAAMLAWQTGESVWNGNNPNLPGLAFNAAWTLGLINKINEAQAPARRAVALGVQYPGSVDAKEAAFLLAYADLMASKSKRHLDAFNKSSVALDNGGWSDFLLALSYADSAQISLEFELPRLARDLIDRGLAETARVAPGNNVIRTNLLVLRTQSSMRLRQYSEAVGEAMEARRSYGKPKSERDLNWAALAAWENASRAVYESVKGPAVKTGSRIVRPGGVPQWQEGELVSLSGQPKECEDIKITRLGPPGPQGIAFPPQEQRDSYAGGAYIRARLDGDGKVISTDILAALPRPAFGAAAEIGIRKWQFSLPASTPVQCRVVDIPVMYAFVD